MYYSKIEPTFSIRIVSLGWVIGVDKYSPGVHAIPTVKIAIETLKRAGLVDLFIAVVIASCVHTHTHTYTHACAHLATNIFFPHFSPILKPVYICNTATRCFFPSADRSYFFPFDSRRDGRLIGDQSISVNVCI